MKFCIPSEPVKRDLDLQKIASRINVYGLVDLKSVESEKFDLYPENKQQEIYDHNVRIFQAYIAHVLLQDLALPDQLRDYLHYTVDYCEKYLCGELAADDKEDEEVDDFAGFIS